MIAGPSGRGTVVVSTGGTGNAAINQNYRQLAFNRETVQVGNASNSGTQDVNTTSVGFNSNTALEGGDFTWSLTGNVVTVNPVDGAPLTFVVFGKLLIQSGYDGEGGNNLSILVRR